MNHLVYNDEIKSYDLHTILYYSTIEIKVSWMELIIRVMIIIKKGESVRVMMFNFSKQQFHLKIILLLKKN